MRKTVIITVTTLALIGAAALGIKVWNEYTRLRASEAGAQGRYAEAIDALGEIQSSLDQIALGDSTVKLLSQNLQTEQGVTKPTSQEAIDRIAEIKGSIERNKERISRLEADLHKRGIKIAGLQKLIAGLRRDLAEKESLVGQLSGTVDSLQVQMSSLASEVAQSQEAIRGHLATIEERRTELATVFFIAAPKKKLAASGVVVAKGGLLGLGRTIEPSGHVDQALLTAIDTDQQTVIPLGSTRAQVVSAQPTASYELKLVDGMMELHILDPKEFRKVRQLIIVTA